jgi:hypothetical protein
MISKRVMIFTIVFNFALEYAIRKVQRYEKMVELDGKRKLLVYTDNVNSLGENINTMQKKHRSSVTG